MPIAVAIQAAAKGFTFGPHISVPGPFVGWLNAQGSLGAALEPTVGQDGQQEMILHELRLEDGTGFIERSLEIGRYVETGHAWHFSGQGGAPDTPSSTAPGIAYL